MPPAVKVYGWAVSPFVARALLCLEEAGVGYKHVPMGDAAGENRRPEHLSRNPFGQVPVLEDGDLTIFESRAIARHVLRKHRPELLLGSGGAEAAAMVDVWLEVEAHQFHPPVGVIVKQCIVNPLLGAARNEAAVGESVERLRKVLEAYEARLAGRRYLAGDFLSLADLSHFPIMRYLMVTEYASLVEACPRVRAWWEELAARPAAWKVTALLPPDLGLSKKEQQ